MPEPREIEPDDWPVMDADEPPGIFTGESEEEEYAAWLRGLPPEVRAAHLADPWTGAGESIPAGFLHHDHEPPGVGFASGGSYDLLAPGPLLATLAEAGGGDYAALGESELIGVMCAWRRLTSWAQAGQAAAVHALACRRERQSRELENRNLVEHVDDELAAALRLTGRSASMLMENSAGLARLPEVFAALRDGVIDWAKACLFGEFLGALPDDAATAIASLLLARAGEQTTGQLRAALQRAVLAYDPEAAERRKKAARRDTQVQSWAESSGNSALAGRELSPTAVIQASVHLTALARWLQARGAIGTIDQLRAETYLALLTGRSVRSLLPAASPDHTASPDHAASPPGSAAAGEPSATNKSPGGGFGPGRRQSASGPATTARRPPIGRPPIGWPPIGWALSEAALAGAAGGDWPRLTGTINLTMPMSTWLGLSDAAGEVAGQGPTDATTCRELASLMDPRSRWCLTVTDPDGHAIGHACARAGPNRGRPSLRWAAGLQPKIQFFESGRCSHARSTNGYHPPGSLGHLIKIRQRTCSAPGCRRAAARCDLDHTVAFDDGGLTCECNLAPLCRRHHRAKQAPGWQLTQERPGRMTWTLPHGRTYATSGAPYPL